MEVSRRDERAAVAADVRRLTLYSAFPVPRSAFYGASSRRLLPGSGLELLDRLDAAAAEGGMFRVLANIGFPVPATFALFARGLGDAHG
jgi:hypothetical protein